MPNTKNVLVNLASDDEDAIQSALEEEKNTDLPVPNPVMCTNPYPIPPVHPADTPSPSSAYNPGATSCARKYSSSTNSNSHPVYNNSEQSPLLSKCTDSDSDSFFVNNIENDPQFSKIIHSTEEAIYMGILPERIYQGSSGSYFVRDKTKVSPLPHPPSDPPSHL